MVVVARSLDGVSTASSAESSTAPWAVFRSAIRHRSLVARLTRREIEARYRGTVLGAFWALLLPLCLIAVYTFVFSVVFQARWGAAEQSRGEFALILFAGLIFFNVFAESIGRAPGLLLTNTAYIKRVVFPLEVLPWVAILSACFQALLNSVVLLCAYFLVIGAPPATALLFPLCAIPVVLLSLALTFLLSSVGVFIRDLQHIIGVVVTVMMFLSPLFYPISALPERFQPLVRYNPIAAAMEEGRTALFAGQPPDFVLLALVTAGSILLLWAAYWWFMKTKKGFADVV